MESATNDTARDRLVDAAFEDACVPATEAGAVVKVEGMMILLILNDWLEGRLRQCAHDEGTMVISAGMYDMVHCDDATPNIRQGPPAPRT